MKKLILLFVLLSLGAQAQIADKIKLMKSHSGYFNFYYDVNIRVGLCPTPLNC